MLNTFYITPYYLIILYKLINIVRCTFLLNIHLNTWSTPYNILIKCFSYGYKIRINYMYYYPLLKARCIKCIFGDLCLKTFFCLIGQMLLQHVHVQTDNVNNGPCIVISLYKIQIAISPNNYWWHSLIYRMSVNRDFPPFWQMKCSSHNNICILPCAILQV